MNIKSLQNMNIKSLQNGIGAASVLGIVGLLASAALGPGSSRSDPPPAATGHDPTPIPSLFKGPTPLSGLPFSLPLTGTSLPKSTASSSTSSSTSSPTNTASVSSPNVAGPPGTATPLSPVTPAPQSGTAAQSANTDPSGWETLSSTSTPTNTQPSAGGGSATTTPAPSRQVEGMAVTLGSGDFVGGTDVAPGLYDVTTGPGASGHFVVSGTDSYDEILGPNGVPKIRVQITNGDQIQIQHLSRVTFSPVSTPLVTTQSAVNLYAGTWTVGADLGPGRYVATPGTGQSGTFTIAKEGVSVVLGGDPNQGQVQSVTFIVANGDVIDISGLGQVALTPA